jgi:hypothetical protein
LGDKGFPTPQISAKEKEVIMPKPPKRSRRFVPQLSELQIDLLNETFRYRRGIAARTLTADEKNSITSLKLRQIVETSGGVLHDDALRETIWWITPHGELILALWTLLINPKKASREIQIEFVDDEE